VRSEQQAAGSRQQAAGSRQQAAGSRQQAGFLTDQHSWLPTPAVAVRPRAPRNLLGFRRDRVHSLDNRPCHNAPGLLRRGSAILHMLGGLTLGEAQQNLMQICSVGVPARASEGPHHQSS